MVPPICWNEMCNDVRKRGVDESITAWYMGPIIILSDIMTDLDRYEAKLEAKKDIQEILLEYFPHVLAYCGMILCCIISGLCAILASTSEDREWVIRLAKGANFFSKTLYWLVWGIVLYNWSPLMEGRTWEGYPRSRESVKMHF
ncbi:hypothetical protein Fcan01_10551 [Folsomia candida]|uniref:Uncharacterized protein n=1 Tax=Folsomia candida TaxID=158441 RepID=A0A226E9B2_FOLCA|nr:hypothetical protein Fcan01_10551 [Folsomia candida]